MSPEARPFYNVSRIEAQNAHFGYRLKLSPLLRLDCQSDVHAVSGLDTRLLVVIDRTLLLPEIQPSHSILSISHLYKSYHQLILPVMD